MSRKSMLIALLLFVVSASSVAARTSSAPPPETAAASTAVGARTSLCFVAALNSYNEAPAPTTSVATGAASFVLWPDRSKMTYHVEYINLDSAETASHIHKGAVGKEGPPVFNFASVGQGGPIKDGVVTFTDQFSVTDLLAGNLYVNIHSNAFPNGAIRGQIMPAGGCFSAALSGQSEVPANASTAHGTASFVLLPPVDASTTMRKLTYHVEYTGILTETIAHIHKGVPGMAGGIVYDFGMLSPKSSPKDGTLTFDGQITLADLLAGNLYANIHSTNFPNGEIRGQIMPSTSCFTVALAGTNEAPVSGSAATGMGLFRLSADRTKLSFYLTRTELGSSAMPAQETATQIVAGPMGATGTPVFTLPVGPTKSGTIALNSQNAADLLAGGLYVNIQSSGNPAGEIRGQIVDGGCTSTYLPLQLGASS